MDKYEVYRLLLVLMATLIYCLPSILLVKHRDKVIRGSIIRTQFPKYAWLPKITWLFFPLWILLFGAVYYLFRFEIKGTIILGYFISFYGLFFGIITRLTSFSYLPYSPIGLFYIHGEEIQKIGWIQILLSIVLICASTYLIII